MTKSFLLFLITITCQNFKIKKPSSKIKISNLIKYSTICCQNSKCTTILFWGQIKLLLLNK